MTLRAENYGVHVGTSVGAALERGLLVYALKIEEDRKRDRSAPRDIDQFPAWNSTAATPWNDALEIERRDLTDKVKIVRREMPENPWIADDTPILLKVPAREVNGWELEEITGRFNIQ